MKVINMIKEKYTRRQWRTFIVICLANFCNCASTALIGPFYPPLAETKNVPPTYYGLIFGAYNLFGMIFSFIFGKHMNMVGAKIMFDWSNILISITDVLFGFLNHVEDSNTFIALSLAIQIMSSVGHAGFLTARNSIIAREFFENAGTTFAVLEIFIGFALMAGPTIGGLLLEIGGFTLPFVAIGVVQLAAGIASIVFLPMQEASPIEQRGRSGIFQVLFNPKIAFFLFAVFAASMNIGFLDVALEPHLRILGVTPVIIGSIFMIRGGAFTFTAPIIGYVCDHKIAPDIVVLVASLTATIGFLLLGPAPFLNLETSFATVIIAMILLGISGGGEFVGAYTGAIRAALDAGLPDNPITYGLVSGVWSTAFYFGAFVGPSVTGIMIDNIGFGWSSVVVLLLHLLVASSIICNFCYRHNNNKITDVISINVEETLQLLTTSGSYGSLEKSYKQNKMYT